MRGGGKGGPTLAAVGGSGDMSCAGTSFLEPLRASVVSFTSGLGQSITALTPLTTFNFASPGKLSGIPCRVSSRARFFDVGSPLGQLLPSPTFGC